MRMCGCELELWKEELLGWHSENSMTVVKLRLLKSTAAQFPERLSLVKWNGGMLLDSWCSFGDR